MRHVFVLLILFFTNIGFAQNYFQALEDVDQLPEFSVAPGQSFGKGLHKANYAFLVYPELAIENDIEGTVYARFVVSADCEVLDIKIERGVNPLLDQAVIDAIKCYGFSAPALKDEAATEVTLLVRYTFRMCQ